MATFPLANKVAQDYLQSKRSFNGQSVVYAVPSFLRGLVTENGAMLASEEQVAAAIQRNDPQGFAQVVQNIPQTMEGAQINGDQIEYIEAPDEGFGEDWLAPVSMIAGYGLAGAFSGAFSGVPGMEGVVTPLSGADAAWGANAGGTFSQAEKLAYVKDASDGIETITRLAEVGNGTADMGAKALGFSSADVAIKSLAPQFASLGVTAAQMTQAASAAKSGLGLKEAMQYAGIAAPVVGALLGSGAIKNAAGAQQEATNAAISQIQGSAGPAQERITAAQLAGVRQQNNALDEGIRFGQETYDRGVTQQNESLNTTIADLMRANETGNTEQRTALATARGDLAPWRDAGSAAITNLGGQVNDPNSSLMRKFTVADFMEDPVIKLSHQFGLDEGTKALSNMARSRGTLNSGSTLKALDRYATDYTGTKAGESRDRFVGDQNNTFSRLMGVSNVGQEATNATNAMGIGTAADIARRGDSTATTAGGFRANTANNIANSGNLLSTNAAQLRARAAENIANSGNVASTNNANIEIGKGNSIAQLLSGQGNARGAAAIATGNTMSNAANSIGNWWSSQDTLDKILAARKAA